MKFQNNLIIPLYDRLPDAVRDFMVKFSEGLKKNHADLFTDINPRVVNLPVDSATPSVKDLHLKVLVSENANATAITNLTQAQHGQIVVIVAKNNKVSIGDSGNFKLSAAWTPDADDTITLCYQGNIWHELARSAN